MRIKILACFLMIQFFSACTHMKGTPNMAENFTVHNVFGDNMVLQRDRKIRISGTCPEKQAVKVSLAGKTVIAFADNTGAWEAVLPPMSAGGPYELTIAGAGERILTIKNILIGEVWLCSGQSNMSMPLWSETPFWRTEGGKEEAAASDFPQIRLYNANLCSSVAPEGPRTESKGPGWTCCNSETAAPFSAAGYYFAKQLQSELQVPVGMINCSWGGTPIQSWISRDGYQQAKRQRELEQIDSLKTVDVVKVRAEQRKQLEDWEELFLKQSPEKTAFAEGYSSEDCDDSHWQQVKVPAPVTLDFPGVFWYRREIIVPAGWRDHELEIGLGAIDEVDFTWFNGVQIGKTGSDEPNYWLKKRVYRIPASLVKVGQKNTLAIRVINFQGATGMEGPAADLFLRPFGEKDTSISLVGKWKYRVEFNADPSLYPPKPKPLPGYDSPAFPATLFNSMIAPWCRYTIRGILWYQGESNAEEYADYYQLQKALLEDWRRQWDDPDMAFVLTQLAAFQSHSPAKRLKDDFWELLPPEDNSWSKLRETQRAMLKEHNTGMAVTIDIGDHSDIHPANKKTLGFRLAQEAKRICYGYQGVSAGPLYRKMKQEGDRVRLFFDNVGGGLFAKDGELQCFAIAGKDGRFYRANAHIDGETILVWSEVVPKPQQVRYAWAKFPGNPNLYNAEGFPASPFQTAKSPESP